jgi:type II secretory pathway pseudopilin PulG
MSARTVKGPALGLEPRVQLLPPMVKQRERNRRSRRLMVFAVFVAIAVIGGATAFGFLRATQAAAALSAEQARTAQILEQQAQYSEATKVNGLVSSTKMAQQLVTTTEVRWSQAMAEMNASVPAGYEVVAASAEFGAPWESAIAPTGVLRKQGVAVITVVLGGAEYRPPADFTRIVSFLDGVSDFFVEGTELKAGGYHTTVTFTLDTSKLAGRFLEGAGDEATDVVPTPAPTETATEQEDDQ